jgi:hypothetical protein
MKAMLLPEPEFNDNQSQTGGIMVRVTLRNNLKQRRSWIDRDVAKIVGDVIASGFSEKEKRVVNWAAEHDQIKISDVMKLLDITWHSARHILFDLTKKQVLQYVRFRDYEKDKRDSKAYFRLRSNEPLPEGAFEQIDLEHDV